MAALKLNDLLKSCRGVVARHCAGQPWQTADADPLVTSITDDSRRVTVGSVFVARHGERTNGGAFIGEAISRGAVAVISEPGSAMGWPGHWIEVASAPQSLADLAEAIHGSPGAQLQLVGVTGTNGKTTITSLIRQLLNSAGSRCGLIGTIEVDDGGGVQSAVMTTPGSVELSAMLARMVSNGCSHAAMEVSSHALAQDRVAALPFRVAVFTNLTGDHLDYHGTMESYADSKARLFAALAAGTTAIVNAEDPAHGRMLRDCHASVLSCAFEGRAADCTVKIEQADMTQMNCTLRGPWGAISQTVPMVGRHNAMNVLQAVAAAHSLGVPLVGLIAGLQAASAPAGRLEPVHSAGDDIAVLVDYAHTDDALRNVLSALRGVVRGRGRLVALFGCGGDRDRTKRPRMAQVAAELADVVWVTSDNPRSEEPTRIIREILAGVPERDVAKVRIDADRSAAIAAAVSTAREGDVVLVAGKGHEKEQVIGAQRRPFDDVHEARTALTRRRQRRREAES